MKKTLYVLILALLSLQLYSQQNMLTLNGGYSFANIEDTEVKGTGWRINGQFEFNPLEGPIAHGISFGYIALSAEVVELAQTVTYKINSFPVYYQPKFIFGTDKFKGFVKGALGLQFAGLKREGSSVDVSDHDFGFYGGGGAGIRVMLGKQFFINAEYEIAWASNSWYKDGWMNTAMGGVGMKF